jgi:hypothetical protein
MLISKELNLASIYSYQMLTYPGTQCEGNVTRGDAAGDDMSISLGTFHVVEPLLDRGGGKIN